MDFVDDVGRVDYDSSSANTKRLHVFLGLLARFRVDNVLFELSLGKALIVI